MAKSVSDITSRTWDHIIVGTGMGGSTLGYSLARAGHSVLFLERGNSHLQNSSEPLLDDFPERLTDLPGDGAALPRGGRYPEALLDLSRGKPRAFTPFIGSGTGGSSALYGMALERFFEQDFSPGDQHAGSDAALPAHWPLSYGDLSAFYRTAEALYRVRGSADPLRPQDDNCYLQPPALAEPNRELFDFFKAKGLHPYALPMACEFTTNCNTCQSFLCSRNCKNDSSRICLQPALEAHNAALLANCEVLRIEASATSVNALQCNYAGSSLSLKAHNYILAAGALESPRLLLASASAAWPDGVGNGQDLVGRHLMRHYIDLYAVFTRSKFHEGDLVKQLAFNDLYSGDGRKLGSVQSFGLLPPADLLAQDMQHDIKRDLGAVVGALFGLGKPVVRAVLGRVLRNSVLLATTLEDLPFRDNRVSLVPASASPDNARLAIRYRPGAGEEARINRLRQDMRTLLKPYRYLLLKQAENNDRIAHACGTCRFGDTAATSVCDSDQKVHGIDNLYIADSSVFPSSGGINPSLTIAALSLRLAARLGAPLNV